MLLIDRFPESPYATKAFDEIMNVYYRYGEFEKIVELHEYANKVKKNANSLFIVAMSYISYNDYKKISDIILQISVSDLDESHQKAFYYLAVSSLYMSGKLDEAKKYEDEFLEQNPQDVEIYSVIGSSLIKSNNIENAIQYVTKYSAKKIQALENFTDSELNTLLFYQQFLMDHKKFKEAYSNLVNLSNVISEKGRYYFEYLLEYGKSAFYVNDFSTARDLLEKVGSQSSNNVLVEEAKDFLRKLK